MVRNVHVLQKYNFLEKQKISGDCTIFCRRLFSLELFQILKTLYMQGKQIESEVAPFPLISLFFSLRLVATSLVFNTHASVQTTQGISSVT